MRTGHAARRSVIAGLAAVALVALSAVGAGGAAAGERHGAAAYGVGMWRGAWAASLHAPGETFLPNWSKEGFANQTVRQIVRVSTGGTLARVELSNRYGTTPLRVAGATVARTEQGAAVRAGSVRELSFGHGRAVTIPAGGTAYSEALPFRTRALESLTVTLYLAEPTGPATYHWDAESTSYRASGDHRADRGGEAFTEQSGSWYYLSGVEVLGGQLPRRDAVVTFGDSITDGFGSTPGADNRYPDELAERLVAAGRPRGVLNHGIGANQLTNDLPWAGEKGVSRFERDALTEPNVGTVIVLQGINDIGMSEWQDLPGGPTPDVPVERLIDGHRDLIRQAHAKGVKVIGATLPPYKGAMYYTEHGEAKRDALNHWIRTSGEFDAVVDMDRVLADPTDPDRLAPAYDVGDHLHPNDAGYRAMAEAVDLDEL